MAPIANSKIQFSLNNIARMRDMLCDFLVVFFMDVPCVLFFHFLLSEMGSNVLIAFSSGKNFRWHELYYTLILYEIL